MTDKFSKHIIPNVKFFENRASHVNITLLKTKLENKGLATDKYQGYMDSYDDFLMFKPESKELFI